jgi:hypothetical protein
MNFRLGFLAALSCLGTVSAQEEPIFCFGDVVKKAEALAQQPFAPQLQQLSPDLQNLDYDLYRRIRFLPVSTATLCGLLQKIEGAICLPCSRTSTAWRHVPLKGL